MQPLFPIPANLQPPVSDCSRLWDANKYDDIVTLCEQTLTEVEKQLPQRNPQSAHDAAPDSAVYQYHALTLILVNALAALEEWKPAKETLGKYRVRFPRDPWGFSAGAQVTRLDPAVKDKDAVQRAVELLDSEAQRLQAKP